MKRGRGLTLVELLVGIVVLGLALSFLGYALTRPREDAGRRRCRSNLLQLAKGMATAMPVSGKDRGDPSTGSDDPGAG